MRYGSVNQFKPYIAVYIYQKFKPKRILDISAGWGDRLISAMSQNIDYIGIDSNINLRKPYNEMINDFKNKSESKVKMIFSKSENVNYSSLPPYDMIFTSPPYFTLEKYQNMKEYKDYDDFINSYFIPTINKSFNHLLKGGYLILNMPEKMYISIKPLLGSAKILKMPIRNRFAYKSNKPRTENIYYWKK
jgi:tRNA1(Val) A37 N6-methylase TrmN6